MKRTFLFLNGECDLDTELQCLFREGDRVVAVDGGVVHAARCGLSPALIIGDFDSAPSDLVVSNATRVVRFEADKDKSDFELALEELGPGTGEQLLVCGALGGRLDHLLMNFQLLERAVPTWGAVCTVTSRSTARFTLPGEHWIKGEIDDTISLVPLDAVVTGLSITGVKWPLENVRVSQGSTQTLSNCFRTELISLTYQQGRVLVVHSRERGEPFPGFVW